MADQDERDARLVVIAKPAINSDVDFMELIREFPTLYNKKAKIFTIKERKKTVGS
jgi:flagellar basal body P-ring protein FlgI